MLLKLAPMPRDVKPGTHDDVLYIAPSMPWIDPAREVTAWLAAVQASAVVRPSTIVGTATAFTIEGATATAAWLAALV